ncbi:hypothetical protein EQ718_14680 (plasmid) [Paracoccus versutus]|uniref:Cytosolic protein n=1 Tax=Paracoccus versutus TaxID=34007 RepID=A0AAQ0KJQ2_PARVE|nr:MULTISPECIES: DUF6282 family protein [Paracoccus]SFY43442.1 hypothetical protein SAMN04244548_04687 [Paracoccus pantotrophus]KGJ10226.1 hypothetical protein IT40_13275 [Paracoccus versutus]MBT0782336.1 hypothetical protein [Paracoccus sp. pheM1]REG30257.1 hypothetical protein ATH84_10548 [Paracoccus versutus]WEJ80152.1 hypothetical protein EQ718_14680 [Paracoccus versutus]
MTAEQNRIDDLMKGAVDLHVHSGPSLHPRKLDHIAALREADRAGMAAVLLKDHYYPTMPLATLINQNMGFRTRAIGSIVLNNPLGGLNPSAVDYALKQGARVVWMATAHAQNHMEHEAQKPGFKFPQNSKKTVAPVPLTLTDEKGVVRDEVKHILDLIAEADAVVSGGHHHARELLPFYEEAKARGVKRLFLNHPTYVNDCSLQDVAHLVGMGVKMEHSVCMFIPSTFQLFDEDHLRAVIEAAGVDNTFFGTDLGQTGNPDPVEGMRQMIAMLIKLGHDDDDIRKMTSTVGAELVGLAA